jgi:hypothetical protein
MLKCRVQVLGGVLFVIRKTPGLLWRLQLCVSIWGMRGKGILHGSLVCTEYFRVSLLSCHINVTLPIFLYSLALFPAYYTATFSSVDSLVM